MSTTPYPPTDYTAVLSAKMGLTTEFGMESGDPHLYGRAHRGHSLCAWASLSLSPYALVKFAHPEGYIACVDFFDR